MISDLQSARQPVDRVFPCGKDDNNYIQVHDKAVWGVWKNPFFGFTTIEICEITPQEISHQIKYINLYCNHNGTTLRPFV